MRTVFLLLGVFICIAHATPCSVVGSWTAKIDGTLIDDDSNYYGDFDYEKHLVFSNDATFTYEIKKDLDTAYSYWFLGEYVDECSSDLKLTGNYTQEDGDAGSDTVFYLDVAWTACGGDLMCGDFDIDYSNYEEECLADADHHFASGHIQFSYDCDAMYVNYQGIVFMNDASSCRLWTALFAEALIFLALFAICSVVALLCFWKYARKQHSTQYEPINDSL